MYCNQNSLQNKEVFELQLFMHQVLNHSPLKKHPHIYRAFEICHGNMAEAVTDYNDLASSKERIVHLEKYLQHLREIDFIIRIHGEVELHLPAIDHQTFQIGKMILRVKTDLMKTYQYLNGLNDQRPN